MKATDSCWDCGHLVSEQGLTPPLFCRAYPRGRGIPFVILAGILRHDHPLGDEEEIVVFDPKKARG